MEGSNPSMAKTDSECVRLGQQASQPNYHVENSTICPMCQAHYCLSDSWGCPTCQFGAGLDRRESVRVTEPPVQVRIVSNGVE